MSFSKSQVLNNRYRLDSLKSSSDSIDCWSATDLTTDNHVDIMVVSAKVMLRENVLESFAAHQKALGETDLSESAPYLQRPSEVAATHSGNRELPFAVYPASHVPQTVPQIEPCDAEALLNLLSESSPIGSKLPAETQAAISIIRSEHLVLSEEKLMLRVDGIPQKATPFSSDPMLLLSNSGRAPSEAYAISAAWMCLESLGVAPSFQSRQAAEQWLESCSIAAIPGVIDIQAELGDAPLEQALSGSLTTSGSGTELASLRFPTPTSPITQPHNVPTIRQRPSQGNARIDIKTPKYYVLMENTPPLSMLKRVAAVAGLPVLALEDLSLQGPVPVAGAETPAEAERIVDGLRPTGVPVVVQKATKLSGKGIGGLISLVMSVALMITTFAYFSTGPATITNWIMLGLTSLTVLSGFGLLLSGQSESKKIHNAYRTLKKAHSDDSPEGIAESARQSARRALINAALPELAQQELFKEIDTLEVPIKSASEAQILSSACDDIIAAINEAKQNLNQHSSEEGSVSVTELHRKVRQRSRQLADHLKMEI